MEDRTIHFSCQCESFEGSLQVYQKHKGFHVYSYCCDCQGFNKTLNSTHNKLNQNGGTELYQTRPGFYTIHKGINEVRAIKHTKKGLMRWYTACCKTQIGNTMARVKIPFIGIPVSLFKLDCSADNVFDPIEMRALAKYARPDKTPGSHDTFPLTYRPKIIGFMLKGMIKGWAMPHPFYNPDGTRKSPPTIGEIPK